MVRHRILALLLALAACPGGPLRAAPPPRADDLYRRQGYWEPPRQWFEGVIPINAALFPGDSTHSQVLGWADRVSEVWQWNPGDTIPAVPAPSQYRSLTHPIIYGMGLATLPDGRLLAAGSTNGRSVGTRNTRVFDPATRAWTQVGDLFGERWYSASALLGDGSVTVVSGARHPLVYVMGGSDSAGQALRGPRAITCGGTPGWTDTALVGAGLVTAREGAAALTSGITGGMVVFGGRRGATCLDDIWTLRYNYFSDVEGTWTADSLPLLDAAYPKPPPRWRHGMAQNRTGDTLWVFGGLDASGAALGDVWRLPIKPTGRSHWEPVSPAGAGPGARSGHVFFYDDGSRFAPDKASRLLVLGGRDGSGNVMDTVWALTGLGPSASLAWVTGAVRDSFPAAREGHVAVYDRVNASPRKRLFVFGGSGSGGALLNDTWLFSRTDTSVVSQSTERWAWSKLNVGGAQPLPSPRQRAVGAYDELSLRLIVFGGETAHGKVADIWTLGLSDLLQPSLTTWDSTPGTPPLHDPMPVARSGAAAAFDSRSVLSILAERYNPATAQWDTVPNGRRWMDVFPRTFSYAPGKVFQAGTDSLTSVLDLNNPVAPWGPLGNTHFQSANAAQFEPGRILACGGFRTGGRKSAWIDLKQPSPAWQPTNDLDTLRTEFQLTLLPDGNALITGGEANRSDPLGSSVTRPLLWASAARAWKPDTLARSPVPRDDHASALLLPDGRVMTGGGKANPNLARLVTIYWPPYLFTASGAVAPRPAVLDADSAIAPGDSLRIVVSPSDSFASVCLMRPTAMTHQLDANQRYVPLQFRRSGPAVVRARVPAAADSIPPGDYLLYLVDAHGVPSIGRWVRVAAGVSQPSSSPGPASPRFVLHAVVPNPSPGTAAIGFTLSRPEIVDIGIFDVEGRRVRRLARGASPAGRTTLYWDGRDSAGTRVAAGVYFVRLRLEDGTTARRRLVVLR